MATLIFPTSIELHEIEQIIAPRMMAGRRGIELLPPTSSNSHIVEWEQKDVYGGMQQLRGLNGDPRKVPKTGGKRFMFAPGVYGEFEPIDEMEITKRRQWGSLNQMIKVDDLVRDAQEKLLVRRLNRIEYINWQLFLYGTFNVPTPAEGAIPGGAVYRGSYATQTYASGISWVNHATSTPLADLRAMALLGRGKGVSFGPQATLLINQTTANHLLANTNPADLGAYRNFNAIQLDSVGGVNILLGTAGVPKIEVYDEGDFLQQGGPWTLYIPDLKGVLFGKRPSGVAYGKYLITRNANNLDLSGAPYTRMVDDPNRIPRQVDVHDGHNGGPALEFPGSILSCTF